MRNSMHKLLPAEGLKVVGAILALMFIITGCTERDNKSEEQVSIVTQSNDSASTQNDETPPNTQETMPVTEAQAMQIAMQGLDSQAYTATSAIFGPLTWNNEQIYAYEVTVNGGDHILLRYVNATTGEFLYDVRHEISEIPNVDSGSPPPPSYYTSCPSGWPLCIHDPDSITFYSQNDPGYACEHIGNSSWYTIGSEAYGASCSYDTDPSGCYIAAYAMSLCRTGHGCNSPSVLNTKKSCFSGPNVSGSCIASKFGGSYSTISLGAVWSTVASGIPVIITGYSTCLGSNHAQMIWGHDGSRYWTKDPWYDWPSQDQSMCINSPTYRVIR